MRGVGVLSLVLALAGSATAGEIILKNGSRLQGDLTNEVLVVSTGAGLIEVTSEQVGLLSPGEIRLKDGRTVRGTVVGGHVKARTSLGELAIQTDELRWFRADDFAPGSTAEPPASPAVTAAPIVPVFVVAKPVSVATATPAAASQSGPSASFAGLPPVSLYQGVAPVPSAPPRPSAPVEPSATPSRPAPAVASLPPDATPPAPPGGRLEVIVGEAPLYRDALEAGDPVGTVARGQQVTYLDSIDRRLRIFNRLVYDGGYWVKVRAADGIVGWIRAEEVRKLE